MNHFEVTLDGKVCMDVGASTGGFTDCMLQNGAVKVYSIDVGYGQLDWKLRNDPRVVCMEKTNIRYVVPEDLQEPADFSSIDVSFISLTKVLLPVRNLLTENGEIVCLIKPQFEAGREKVGKKAVGGFILATLIGMTAVRGICSSVWLFTFQFTLLPAAIVIVLYFIIAVIASEAGIYFWEKGSITERLRNL